MARSQGLNQLLEDARREAMAEISIGIMQAISDGMERHGDDPELVTITGTAVVHAIMELDRGPIKGFAELVRRSVQDMILEQRNKGF